MADEQRSQHSGTNDLQRFDYGEEGPCTFEEWCRLTGYTARKRKYRKEKV